MLGSTIVTGVLPHSLNTDPILYMILSAAFRITMDVHFRALDGLANEGVS